MGVKSKLSAMLNTTPAPFANTLPYVTLPYVLLTFHTQSVLDLKYRSAPSFSTQRSSLPCHSQRSAAVYPVILNTAQRSEESKIIAHPPFTDLTFLPSLETTRPNFCYSERILSSRTLLLSCHSEQPPSVIHSKQPPILSSRTALPFLSLCSINVRVSVSLCSINVRVSVSLCSINVRVSDQHKCPQLGS